MLLVGDAILTCDSGTIATWAARHFHIRGDREFYVSGNLASMAPGPRMRSPPGSPTEAPVLGHPEHCVRWERRADFAPWATACGGLGLCVDAAADVEPTIFRRWSIAGRRGDKLNQLES